MAGIGMRLSVCPASQCKGEEHRLQGDAKEQSIRILCSAAVDATQREREEERREEVTSSAVQPSLSLSLSLSLCTSLWPHRPHC